MRDRGTHGGGQTAHSDPYSRPELLRRGDGDGEEGASGGQHWDGGHTGTGCLTTPKEDGGVCGHICVIKDSFGLQEERGGGA